MTINRKNNKSKDVPTTTENGRLLRALKKYFGFDTFKGDQEAIIKNLLKGNDTFVLMPTGGGKSLCYQLPALLLDGTAIVISPLIALMKNQVDVLSNLSEAQEVAHYINSSLTKASIEKVKKDIKSGKTKLLYVAPESLHKDENVDFLQGTKISFYAIDESHCISEWGHDFRPEYRRIRPIIDKIGRAPIIALTATATDKVRIDIKKNLGMVNAQEFKSSFNRPNLYYEIRQKTKEVDKDVIKFLRKHTGKSGIIYCLSRKKVEDLAAVLCANDIKAAPYHAGLDAITRTQTQDDFLMERIDVIVATIAFGMGIDKPDVRFVIHYDVPKSLEGYYQETGRAGRDGGEGICLMFYSRKDVFRLEKFMEKKPVAEQEIGRLLLNETASYAESSVCRRKMLLHYFGESYKKDNCESCDNCLHPKEMINASEQLVVVLSVIEALKESFCADYIINFITGRETNDIIAHHHNDDPLFGQGEDNDPNIWHPLINQAQIAGYINKDVENYGLLKVTATGKRFIKKPCDFFICKDNEALVDEEMFVEQGESSGALDLVLNTMLVDLRRDISKRLNRPPFVIFQDVSIEQMATEYPITLEELKNIQGVGEGKTKQPYAKEFVDLIKQYCQENDIERQIDLKVRTVAKRSTQKINIIQNIDRKIALDDIAQANGMDFDELLSEVESIVYSGTKLNIDYFIEEIVEEDHIEEIYKYFKTSQTDSVQSAIKALGADYTEEEIRLVRIKLISEMAN